jgi:hypothetical protein
LGGQKHEVSVRGNETRILSQSEPTWFLERARCEIEISKRPGPRLCFLISLSTLCFDNKEKKYGHAESERDDNGPRRAEIRSAAKH